MGSDRSAARSAAMFSAAVGLMLGVTALSFGSVWKLRSDAAMVAHTLEVHARLDGLMAVMRAAESGQRGYLLLGDSTLLRTYSEAVAELPATFDELRLLTRDDVAQQQRIDSLAPLVKQRLALLEARLALGATATIPGVGTDPSIAPVLKGSILMRHIARLVDEMRAEEDRLLEERSAALRTSELQTALALLTGALLSVALVMGGFRVLRQELDSRNHAERRLQESEARFRRLAEASPDAIVIVAEGRIVDVNPALVALFGYTADELRGQSPDILAAPECRAVIAQRVAAGVERPAESIAMRKDGTTFPAAMTARTMTLDGQAARVTVLHDLSGRDAVDRMKREFVSVVSHELRTPLTSIRGSLGLVEGGLAGPLPPKALELVRIARSNTDRLVRLINDILDIEKIESGRMELRLDTLGLRELVAAAVEEMQGSAQQSGVALAVSIDEEVQVRGDRDRLLQVLTNLLSNAIKFSPEGGTVTTSVRLEGDAVRVSVEDRGPGIPVEQLPHLFQKFMQLDSSDRRSKGGTGLGLAISKAIVDMHDGVIGVDSEQGVGTVFWLELPATRRRALVAPATAAPAPRILLVEDDSDHAWALSELLEPAGYVVSCVGTLRDALSAAREERFDAVLLDVGLPDGDGLELVRRMRLDEPPNDVPVIVVSGREADGTFQDPRLVDWIPKPFGSDRLRRALHHAVRRPGPARALVVDDDESSRAVIAARLRALGVEVHEACDGAQALAGCGEHAPDLVVLDVSMPNVDGFDFVASCRESRLVAPPLLVYTGMELDAADRRRLALGITRHLTKARASEAQFTQSIRELLGRLLDEEARAA
ncbi:MAG TPA: response regulator [Gemmatimonadales bacterium]